MNKKEFLDELRKSLSGLKEEDIKEILEDYEEHFKVGKKRKRKESEIANALGNPKEIAKEAKGELNFENNSFSIGSAFLGLWKETKKTTKRVLKNLNKEINNFHEKKKKEKAQNKNKRFWKKTLVLSLNIFIMFWIMLAFYITVFSLFVSGISIILAGIVTTIFSIFILINPTDFLMKNISLAGFFAGVGILCLGIIWSIFSLKLGKILSWVVKRYIKLTKGWTKK